MEAAAAPIWFIIPAAGSGQRFAADSPKQFLVVAGKTVLQHTLDALLAHPSSVGAVVALAPNQRLNVLDASSAIAGKPVLQACGGNTRAESVLASLLALPANLSPDTLIAVHDAARPCVPTLALTDLFERAIAHPVGAIWAQALTDTIKRSEPNRAVAETLDRSQLWRAQTPQIFRLGALKSALMSAFSDGVAVSDESQAMERLGHFAELVQCPVENIKLTHMRDLPALERFFLSNTP